MLLEKFLVIAHVLNEVLLLLLLLASAIWNWMTMATYVVIKMTVYNEIH